METKLIREIKIAQVLLRPVEVGGGGCRGVHVHSPAMCLAMDLIAKLNINFVCSTLYRYGLVEHKEKI